MSLYEEWQDLLNNQTDESFPAFWEEYSRGEATLYTALLKDPKKAMTGTLKELSEKYSVRPVIFMGFLDGINDSLKKPAKIEKYDYESEIKLNVDFEKLYFNMQAAKADHLYSLEAWDAVLNEEKRDEITKEYKKSKTVIKEKTPGRNDACPCGSGKKYKKCCGK